MKKILIVLILFAGGIVLAQKGEKGSSEGMKDLSPEQIATLQTKKATLALDLTEAQQVQMKTFFLEEARLRRSKMEERKVQKESGEKKVMTSEDRYAKANARLDRKLAQKEKLSSILSDAQMEKWQKIKRRRGKHRKGKGKSEKKKQE